MGLILDNNAILSADTLQRYNAIIAHNNLFRASEAIVTPTSEQVGYEAINAYKEGQTFDFWKPSTVATQQELELELPSSYSVNYVAFAAHNLFSVGNAAIQVQNSSDGIAWSDSFTPAFIVPDDSPFIYTFAAVSNVFHKINFTTLDAIPSIGVVSIGHLMNVPVPKAGPYVEPRYARENRYINERSETGQILGKQLISEGAAFNLTVRGIESTWIRDIWEPNIRSIEQYPFFAAVVEGVRPLSGRVVETFYGIASSQPSFSYDNQVYGTISLNAAGIVT